MGTENSASFRKGKKAGPGRPKGLPNKATSDARQAIAAFVEGNAHRLTHWLDDVANGVLEPGDNPGKYVVPPNPSRAFEMFQSVVEYHIPKLARTEHVGDADNPIRVEQITRRIVHPNPVVEWTPAAPDVIDAVVLYPQQ